MDWYRHRVGQRKRLGKDWYAGNANLDPTLHPVTAWDLLGRGYSVSPCFVDLEPPFIPFGDFAAGLIDHPFYRLDNKVVSVTDRPQPRAALTLCLPLHQRVTPYSMGHLLSSLRGLVHPLSFELYADETSITYQMTAARLEVATVAAQVHIHFPLAVAKTVADPLQIRLEGFRGQEVGYFAVDYGLEHPSYQPLRQPSQFSIDPMAGVIGAISHLQSNELAGIQVLFTPCRRPWGVSLSILARELRQMDGVADGKKRATLTDHKISAPLYACVIRVFALTTRGNERAFQICRQIGGAFETHSEPGSNALVALDNVGYPDDDHLKDVLERRSRRFGMLLSSTELIGIVHPPCESISTHKLVRIARREVPLPSSVAGQRGARLGVHVYQGKEQEVCWPDTLRTRHAYLLGGTRVGKSTLLLNLITQDLARGGGLCVIDPHGDLSRDVLSIMPNKRLKDVLYLNFADRDFPAALNLLEPVSDDEQGLLCSDLLSILSRLFASSWGDRLEHILRFCLLTLLSVPGHTVRDIRNILSDERFRNRVTSALHQPDIRAFWDYEFPQYAQSAFAPIHNKLGQVLANPTLRNIIAQPQSRLDFGRAMAEKKVLIVNLSVGELGDDASSFLGAMLVSRIQIAAMRSLRLGKAERTPFTLYVDEFQNFLVSSFEKILSEAGKVNLTVVMANQFLGQLSPSMLQAILGNIGALIAFRIGIDDAKRLEKDFGGRFTQDDLLSQARGEAIVKMGSAQESFNLATSPPPPAQRRSKMNWIVNQTRVTVCRPRAEVEAELAAQGSRATPSAEGHKEGTGTKRPVETPPGPADAPSFYTLPD